MKIQDKAWLASLAPGDSIIWCDTKCDPVEIASVPITRISKTEIVVKNPHNKKLRFSRLTGLGIGDDRARRHWFVAPLSVARLMVIDAQWRKYQLLTSIGATRLQDYTVERLEAILAFIREVPHVS